MLTFIKPMDRFSIALLEETNAKGIDWFSLLVCVYKYSHLADALAQSKHLNV